jgi:hypothetical protein
MSLSQLKYDDCAYTQTLKQSISPGDYMLQTPRPCQPCFVASPGIMVGGYGASLCENLIDVDSELMNITRKASDCPSKKYLPGATQAVCGKLTHARECAEDLKVTNFLTPEDTLISNPKCTNKERSVNRWEWLCRDPRERAIVPFPWFVANRIVVKDSHRPLMPELVDQSVAMPKPQSSKCSTPLDEQFNHREFEKKTYPFPSSTWKNDSVQFGVCGKF